MRAVTVPGDIESDTSSSTSTPLNHAATSTASTRAPPLMARGSDDGVRRRTAPAAGACGGWLKDGVVDGDAHAVTLIFTVPEVEPESLAATEGVKTALME